MTRRDRCQTTDTPVILTRVQSLASVHLENIPNEYRREALLDFLTYRMQEIEEEMSDAFLSSIVSGPVVCADTTGAVTPMPLRTCNSQVSNFLVSINETSECVEMAGDECDGKMSREILASLPKKTNETMFNAIRKSFARQPSFRNPRFA